MRFPCLTLTLALLGTRCYDNFPLRERFMRIVKTLAALAASAGSAYDYPCVRSDIGQQ